MTGKNTLVESDAGHSFRVRIRLLGHFEIVCDGRPLVFGRKTPKMPLALLKRLAAGGNSGADAMADKLWPELDGDAARRAFNITLHRLRKLLGVQDLLLLSGGKLRLDPDKCWIDVHEFKLIVERAEKATTNSLEGDVTRFQWFVDKLLNIYTGHFLEDEDRETWAITCRDQLREKFERTVVNLAASFERRHRWDLAAALYLRALELDNLAEPIYRRLMLCYRELGETAEALRIFRRCRDLLSIVLSVGPSAETRAVHASLICCVAGSHK